MAAFPPVQSCRAEGRENETVVSDLDGTLLRGRSSFPYFMLMAFEGSGVARAAALLLLSPVAWFLYHFVSEASGIKLLIFVSFRGLRESEIKLVARAVLPKFYLRDLHPESWTRFSSFGRKLILTANPRIMVEPLGVDYLGADQVIGSEIEVDRNGRATGFVKSPGVLVGVNKRDALKAAMGGTRPDVGLGDRITDHPFMSLCREGYVVPLDMNVNAVPKEQLPRPILFHDGRLVKLPTPAVALLTLLWAPVGFGLAVIRIAAGALLPMHMVYWAFRALGVNVIVKGKPPDPMGDQHRRIGVLFVCSHRTLLDPIFLSTALRRPVTAVTYSISRLSEFLSPIRTVQLSRDRRQDALAIQKLLEEGDLIICPEGTTSREPFLLRFSALFAELADQIIPVAMNCHMSMFHGTTARGWKGMDPFYFFMNPNPTYEVTFLEQLPKELTCGGGKTTHEVANHIQRILARTLGFECTNFTRKDKYKVLAGNDGTVPLKTTGMTVINAFGS